MTLTPQIDGAIHLAHRNFAAAVAAFCDRQPVWDQERGVCRWASPLYGRMRSALAGERSVPIGRRMPTSRPPVRMDVIDWLRDVDDTVVSWGTGGGTVHALKSLAARTWRPQDAELLDGRTEQLAAWAAVAADLLHDNPLSVPLRGYACPACGATAAYRRRDGESIRSTALTVSEMGAGCLSCRATWTTEQLPFLATLLGCPALPT